MMLRTLRTVRSLCIFFMTLSLIAPMAHLLELPNKMSLPGREYLVVQQVYKGWSFLGIVEVLTLITLSILVFMVRSDQKVFFIVVQSLFTFIAAMVIFFVFTQPVNTVTENWTTLPQGWEKLRNRWEYSHATRAGLILYSWIMLLLSDRTKETIEEKI